jgi:acyl-CoA reductase-like NAD-dependent aldehyde dehydrogenase
MHNTYLNTINGQLVGAEQCFESFNPATGEVVGTAPISSRRR